MALVGNRQSLRQRRWNQDMVESQPPNNPAPDLSQLRDTFVGRQQELADLKAALDDAMAGQGRLAMLVGEPGIGKTRTAQKLASYAETLNAQVWWGRCYEEQAHHPTGPGCSLSVPTFSNRLRNKYWPRWDRAPHGAGTFRAAD